MLGYPDQALAATEATAAHARRRNHPFDLAFALTLGAQAFDFLRQPEELLRRADEADALGRRYGLPLFCEIMVEISRGIAWIRMGRHAEGATRLERAIGRLAATGHRIWIGYLRATVAEGLELAGETRARRGADRRKPGADRGRRGAGAPRRGAAAPRLDAGAARRRRGRRSGARAAIAVARGQQAKGWELRATMALARLLAARGAPAAGLDALEPVLGWFGEGFGTSDLVEAAALAATLRGAAEDERPGMALSD